MLALGLRALQRGGLVLSAVRAVRDGLVFSAPMFPFLFQVTSCLPDLSGAFTLH